MDDELKKRNTDCVYFLASPLTCKKGMECEFRHSEIARLNPRDCWYWLAGNCLNPTCAFRHPPLEGHPENTLEPASQPHQASIPASKSSVPCYFYCNGFCNKGDYCSFLHGPSSATSGLFSKAPSTVTNAHLLENKTLVSNEGLTASTEPSHSQLEITKKAGESIQFQPKMELQLSASNNILQESPSPQNSNAECDEAIFESDILLPVENLRSPPIVLDRSLASADQSSEDQFDGHREPEERWESSPGFDVLVDDGSEKLGYEDDPEYLISHNGDDRMFHEHLLQYDYEDTVGYDPAEYPESGIIYTHDVYGSYDNPDDEHTSDHVSLVPKRSRERRLNPMPLQKRQLLSREVDFNHRDGGDLRNHLSKRRRISSHSDRSSSPHLSARGPGRRHSRERPGRQHSRHPLQGRLASDIGSDIIGGQSENNIYLQDWPRQEQPRYSQSRQQDKERQRQTRPQFNFSEISRGNIASRDARPTQETLTTFTAPKTLAQIKEEKRKARENREGCRSTTCNGRITLQTFEAPKPLSEILKDKRRLASTSDDNNSSRSRHDHSDPDMHYIGFEVDNDDVLDEYEEDDDESMAV